MKLEGVWYRSARTSPAISNPILESTGAIVKSCLPGLAYRRVQQMRGLMRSLITRALYFGAGYRSPEMLLYFGYAPGDDLLCTSVLYELSARGHSNVWMASNFPDLFRGLVDAACVIPVGALDDFAKVWRVRIPRLDYAPWEGDDHSRPPRRHIIAELCAQAGITGAVAIRPYLALTESEKCEGAWAGGRIVIQSSGMAGRFPMRNKQWDPECFQAVIDTLRGEFEVVQLGSVSDPPLKGAKDLRGRTSIRESASILHHARLYLGGVGFLMHLARATECPSVIIYGGREAPWQSGYICNMNLYSAVPCAPCWRWNHCDFDRICMTGISVEQVVQAIEKVISRPRAPLEVETVFV